MRLLTSNRDALIAQFVLPLATGTAFTTAQTIKGRALAREQTATFGLAARSSSRG